MKQLEAWLVTVMGILLVLSMIGVSALGSISSGITGWVVALAVLIIGVMRLMKK